MKPACLIAIAIAALPAAAADPTSVDNCLSKEQQMEISKRVSQAGLDVLLVPALTGLSDRRVWAKSLESSRQALAACEAQAVEGPFAGKSCDSERQALSETNARVATLNAAILPRPEAMEQLRQRVIAIRAEYPKCAPN